jgi:hypothetical protein
MKEVVASYDLNTRRLSRDIIRQALDDLRVPNYRDSTLAWFNARDTEAMGYGWCLGQSGLNPNIIRKEINALYKPEMINHPGKELYHA